MSWNRSVSSSLVGAVCLIACSGSSSSDISTVVEDAGAPDVGSVFDGAGLDATTHTGTPTGECAKDSDCTVPATEPPNCAEATCDTLLQKCSFRAKDADADGHRAAKCVPVASFGNLPVGDDCDDADAKTYPGAAEVCDGKDHTCGSPTGACNCVNGKTQNCYTGPAGTAGVATCKGGSQTCVNGVWGTCDGQVLPVLEMNAPPDVAHPCNGTNYWCDPAGVQPNHCPQCVTTTAPQACGSATTCNASATRTCTQTGTWGACTPGPINTCAPGNSYNCTTCSTIGFATSGKRTCTSSCNFDNARCYANAVANAYQLYPGNPMFSHQRGAATNPANPAYWRSQAGEAPGYLVYGPYRVLPAGKYRVTFSFYGASGSSDATLDVSRAGQCGGSVGGLCGVTVNPSNNGATTDYTYSFNILADCLDSWEIRVNKLGTGELYLYTMYLFYDGP